MPQDENLIRDFVGNPNPNPASKFEVGAGASAPASGFAPESGFSTDTAPAMDSALTPEKMTANQPPKVEGEYSVTPRVNGEQHIFLRTPDGEDVDLGLVAVPNAEEILNKIAPPNAVSGAWYGVPQEVAMSLKEGKLPLPAFLKGMYENGEVGHRRGMLGTEALKGKMSFEDASVHGDEELLKTIVNERPALWGEGFAGIMGNMRWGAGVAAQILPGVVRGAGSGAQDSAAILAGLGAATLATGGLDAPATIPLAASAVSLGMTNGIVKYTMETEGGNLALDMYRKGFKEDTIRKVAPSAGALMGFLEVAQFKFLAAPFKKAFLKKVAESGPVKTALIDWVKNTTGETSTEVAQEMVSQATTQLSALYEKRPELQNNWKETKKAFLDTLVESLVGMAIIGAPGAAVQAYAGGRAAPAAPKAKTPAAVEDVAGATELSADELNRRLFEQPASVIEKDLVADSPEVGGALEQLNRELNPLSPDAALEYREIGKQLAGKEDVDAALAAKTEALQMEQNQIMENDVQTPEQQNRVAAIQSELSFLDELKTGMTEAPSEAPAIGEAPPTPVSGVKQRVQVAISKARETKLVSEMKSNLEVVKELENARDRLAKAEKPTKALDAKIRELMVRVYKIDEERMKIAEGLAPLASDVLELRPATLESITKKAFTEGRKEVIRRRASQINSLAEQHGLSDRDVKSVIGNRNLGMMTDLDFKNFLDRAAVAAKELADKKQALTELTQVQSDQQLKKEANIRRFHGLPPVAKMTKEQMREYADILAGYEIGDEFWTPKRVEALKLTKWTGANTVREVLEKAAKYFNVPLEELTKIKVSEFDRFRYDTAFARRNPVYNFMVDEIKLAELKNDAAYFEARETLFKLAEAADKSRKRGVLEKLIPTQEAVMAYLEAPDAAQKAAIATNMTQEEMALAQYMEMFYARAYDYLVATDELSSSRFAGGKYVFHAKKPISELLLGVREVGLKDTISELLNRWKLDSTWFNVTDEKTGQSLGLRKFFRQTLFRSGELSPSKNVVKSTDVYMRQFFHKKALDEAIPSMETLVMAVSSLDRSAEGKAAGEALHTFVKTYLNAKKGQAAVTGIQQGGVIDTALRAVSNFISLNMIALNVPLQIASTVGETVVKIPVLGTRKLALANIRKLTPQGRKIIDKYKYFTGEGVLEEWNQPGTTIEEKAGLLTYGLFKWSRVNTMRDLILGNMTKEEFQAGEISNEKLAQIKKTAGRWLDMTGAHSIMGSTSPGKAATKFRNWAIPIMSSTADLSMSLARSLTKMGNPAKRLSQEQMTELYRIAEVVVGVTVVTAVAGEADKDDDSFVGRTKFYALRELSTMVQALSLTTVFTAGVTVAWLERLAQNMQLLVTLQKEDKTGELKGWKRLKRQLIPTVVRQVLPTDNNTRASKKRKGFGLVTE